MATVKRRRPRKTQPKYRICARRRPNERYVMCEIFKFISDWRLHGKPSKLYAIHGTLEGLTLREAREFARDLGAKFELNGQ